MASNSAQRGKVCLGRHVILALTLLLLAAAPSQAQIIFNEILPFDAVVDTTCTGPVHVQGTQQVTFRNEGAGKDSFHFTTQGSGENLLTGAKYRFSDTYNDRCTFDVECPLDLGELDEGTAVIPSVQTTKLIGEGDAPNLLLHVRGVWTFPPLTFTIVQLNATCN